MRRVSGAAPTATATCWPTWNTRSGAELEGCRLHLASKSRGFAGPRWTSRNSQQSAKASATKRIMRWLRDVLHRVDHAGSTLHGKQRLAMMDAFAAFESICERHGRWIPADDVEAMGGFMETALLCLNALAARAAEQNKFTWQIIPKCHMATHLRLRRLLLRCKPKEDHLLRRRGHGRPLQEDHGEVPRQDCRQQPCAEVQHPCLHAVVDETTAVSRASSFLMPHRTVRHHPGCFFRITPSLVSSWVLMGSWGSIRDVLSQRLLFASVTFLILARNVCLGKWSSGLPA